MRTPEERAGMIAQAKFDIANLRVMQKCLAACVQQMMTAMAAATADDWEDRYVAEGVQAIEAAANHKPQA